MHIAGRLALQTPTGICVSPDDETRLKSDILSFHGCDIVVSAISETGFEAMLAVPLKAGALVRLRLPCAGAMLARVVSHKGNRMKADFINPVSAARIGKALGMSRLGGLQPAFA